MELITKTKCPIEKRTDFLPTYTGNKFLQYENCVYDLMGSFSAQYSGGYFEFYHLSNGGFFMALQAEKVFQVEQPSNYFDDTMTAEAFSIGANLYALNFMATVDPNSFNQLYHALRDFALQHGEAGKILAFID